jgi:hypothetical protein
MVPVTWVKPVPISTAPDQLDEYWLLVVSFWKPVKVLGNERPRAPAARRFRPEGGAARVAEALMRALTMVDNFILSCFVWDWEGRGEGEWAGKR